MFCSATLLLLTLTANSATARIHQKEKYSEEASGQATTLKDMHRHPHPLQRHLTAVQRAAFMGGRFNVAANGGTAAGGGNFLDSLLGSENGGSESNGEMILGGENVNGQLQQLLDSILAETEFPQDLIHGDGGGGNGNMNETIAELLQVIMSLVQSGGDGGGNGITNPENSLQTLLSEWLGALEMTNLRCGTQDQSTLPVCAWNLQGEAGVWVCRSIYNPETGVRESVNTCAHPELAFATLDQCGACPAETNAPEIVECTCPCTTTNGETGVGMNVMGFMERCYAAGIVNTAVNNMPFVECTTC
jgi:hypothetical protein